ncbi:hypothetical protein RUM43_007559 [Polyplax serrata]|uniref:KANL2-like probable zinc-finger domain-containing protein n=1 Tax=Polyplax serrata TaxID=468196 RepID=A0AAN8S7Y5_POLSC
MKNDLSQGSGLKELNTYKNQFKFSNLSSFNVNISQDGNIDKKITEKLKVLLKNGGNNSDLNDIPDPYAFSEVDMRQEDSFNNVDFTGKTSTTISKPSNGTNQKSIMLLKSASPQTKSNTIKENDCTSKSGNNLKQNLKVAKVAMSMLATNSFVTPANSNQPTCKLQQNNHIDQNKMSCLKNGKTAQVQLSSNNKPLLNKLFAKAKLQMSKQPNVISAMKSNKNTTGKPASFGQSQVQKQGTSKEKKLDNKHKGFNKGKSLLNQLQKTALLNRPSGQQIRKSSAKTQFFGMNKNIHKHTDGPSTEVNTKNTIRKSLLEESLLGFKCHGNVRDGNSSVVKPTILDISFKNDHKQSFGTGTSPAISPGRLRITSLEQSKHESLERIWNIRNKLKGLKKDHLHFGLTINDGDYDDNSNSECLLFQNYWFSVCGDYDSTSNNDRGRDTKLSQLKVELRHKIKQLQWRYKDEYRDKVVELLVDSARKQPNLTAFLIRLENSKFNNRKKMWRVKPFNLLRPILCSYANPESGQKCQEHAMPCIKFCQQHITQSNDQLLFTSCSALRSDNTSCQAAVLNQSMENPLCLQHKRLVSKSEMPKKLFNSKPVVRSAQPRKRSRSSTSGSNRSGRSRKRRRSGHKERNDVLGGNELSESAANTSPSVFNFGKDYHNNSSFQNHPNVSGNSPVISQCGIDESQEVEVGEEVLAIAEDLPLELATQATKLLEEHDFTNVLNHIPADAFNDLFTEDKEEYEPTPQETEELDRALEAVDKDVKSLEKLSQTQGILDTLLDEQTIAQTLAQLPEVTANIEVPQTLVPVFYQNGFSNTNQLEQTLHDLFGDKYCLNSVLAQNKRNA